MFSPPFLRPRGEPGALLDRKAGVQYRLLVELVPDEVEP
jgi:hypothetical protein